MSRLLYSPPSKTTTTQPKQEHQLAKFLYTELNTKHPNYPQRIRLTCSFLHSTPNFKNKKSSATESGIKSSSTNPFHPSPQKKTNKNLPPHTHSFHNYSNNKNDKQSPITQKTKLRHITISALFISLCISQESRRLFHIKSLTLSANFFFLFGPGTFTQSFLVTSYYENIKQPRKRWPFFLRVYSL